MEIETERLLLRPLRLADLEDLVVLQREPQVVRFIGAYDRAELLNWLREVEREWAERGHGRAAVVERGSSRLVGRTGLRYWPQFDETELGWALDAGARGRGYATEAGRACLDWGFGSLDLDYVTAMIDPENAPSIAVAERLGMRPLREDVLLGDAMVVYAVNRADHSPTGTG